MLRGLETPFVVTLKYTPSTKRMSGCKIVTSLLLYTFHKLRFLNSSFPSVIKYTRLEHYTLYSGYLLFGRILQCHSVTLS